MNNGSEFWPVKVNKGRTLSLPVQIARAWGFEGDPVTLYFFLEGDRVTIVQERSLASYLAGSRPKRAPSDSEPQDASEESEAQA